MPKLKRATLILEDDSHYSGFSFGFEGDNTGEVVFNTGMVGYPESLTDPSYSGQILVTTYPLIGNYGVPKEKKKNGTSTSFESSKIHLRGLIVSEYSQEFSHWRAEKSLAQFLKEQKVPAITGIDTRSLTKKLRKKGVMLGRITFGRDRTTGTIADPNQEDLVGQASIQTPKTYGQGKKKILCLDCGMKNNILHSLLKYDVTIKRVPSTFDIKKEDYDGLFISNGPGDPEKNQELIENIRFALQQDKPIFGICLGNQILALAAGAKTYKLKYGHRSQNQPCFVVGTDRCYLTSQNHGFAVDEKTLPPEWKPWFVNANDKTIEGIKHQAKDFFAVQFHPEATPGPQDTGWLFEKFVDKL